MTGLVTPPAAASPGPADTQAFEPPHAAAPEAADAQQANRWWADDEQPTGWQQPAGHGGGADEIELASPSPAPPRRPRRRQLALLLVAFAAVVAVTLSLDLILPDARGQQASPPDSTARTETTGASDSTTGTTAPPESTAGSETTTAPPESETAPPGGGNGETAPNVPADWTVYANEATGYQIAHPPGWQVQQADGNRVDLVDDGGGRYLRIDWSDQPRDPLEAWQSYEPNFASGRPGYERIRLEPTEFKGMEAAVWEYRYRDGGADLHAINLTFVDDQGELAYALNFQTHAEDWEGSSGLLEQLKASFQPAS